jgi:tape measure domain-containing protein
VEGGDVVVTANGVDSRVVDMQFRSAQFVSGATQVIGVLSRLKESLKLQGAAEGLNQVSEAGRRFSLGGLTNGIERAGAKFNALRVIGFTVLADLTSKAVNAGLSVARAFTIDPIKAGLDVYETKINAIQTILANTSAQGTKLPQVTSALNELNKYANLTVYNFGEMAKNIGTFTAAGVDLNTSVSSIKGIANLAALSGASSEQASSGMYQLSQAIASGTVKLQDWNSVVNAGFGGKVFQKALIDTARAQGVSVDAEIKKFGSFRQSLQSGWLSAKVLTDTLKQFTGDLTASQLKAMGFTEAQTQAILKQGKLAVQSATQIRTVTQLTQALKEEVATAYSKVWETLLGGIGPATKTLTAVHNVLENLFTKPIYDLNNFLQVFIKLGGKTALFTSLVNVFHVLMAVIRPIKEAFRDIFPPLQVATLVALAYRLELFTDKLVIGWKTQDKIRQSAEGLFSVLRIGVDLIVAVFHGLGTMFSIIKGGNVHVLDATAKVGGFLTNLRKTIEAGNIFTKFFVFLGKILAYPVKLIESLTHGISLFGRETKKAGEAVKPFSDKLLGFFSKLGSLIAKALQNGDLSQIARIIDQILLGGVLISIKKFISKLGGKSESKGLFDTIKESFESLTGTLKSMQQNLKSDILLKIAAAVALLSASMVALSFIDVKNLGKALGAMSVVFTEMLSSMAILVKISAGGGIFKMTAAAAALNLMATAVVILSGAIAILSKFSWAQIGRGLAAIGGLLTGMIVFSQLVSSNPKGVVAGAYAMQIMASALNIMAFAVGRLGKMDFGTLEKGIGSIATILLIVAGFNRFGGKTLIGTAIGLTILGGALIVIAQTVKTLGAIPMGQLAKGIGAIAAALVLIAGAMFIMPPDLPLTATGLLIVSAALEIIAQAIVKMGGMSWESIGKGLVVLAGSLILISAAMIAMTGALPGAAALLVVAGALAILTPVLLALGSMSWGNILKGLVALAGVFTVIGVAGLLLAPVVPVLLGLGAAIVLIGVGILAAGVGVAAFAVGLTALSVAGGAAISVLVAGVSALAGLIPLVFKNVGLGLIELAKVIGQGGPAITKAIATLLIALLNAIIKVAPKAGKAFEVITGVLLEVIRKETPKVVTTFGNILIFILRKIASYGGKFVEAGLDLVINILNGIARKISSVIAAGANIIIAFVNGVASQTLRVVHAAAVIIIHFINALANEIRTDTPQMDAAIRNLADAMIHGFVSGLAAGAGSVASAALNIGEEALNALKSHLHINSPSKKTMAIAASFIEGFVTQLNNQANDVRAASISVGNNALDALGKSLRSANDILAGNMNLSPTITPVIDLSKAQKGLSTLNGLTKAQALNAKFSTSSAIAVSAANDAIIAAASVQQDKATNGTVLNYTQVNNSPKALDAATIYRQTKNHLATVKDAIP